MIYIDGGDHVTSGDDKFTTGNPSLTSGAGLHTRAYDTSAARGARDITALTTLSGGCKFRIQTDASDNFFRFMDTSATNQVVLRYVAGGRFAVARGNTPTVLQQSALGTISTGTDYYAELSVTINNSTGSYTANLYDSSGSLITTLTASGVDTQETANNVVNRFDAGGTVCDALIEDIWINGDGTLYGPLRVETIYPTGDGSTQQWAIGAGSGAHWEVVDEEQNNDTTDYVRSLFNGEIELFTFPARALSGAIHAIQVTPVAARSASVGGMTFRPLARIDSTNYAGATKTLTDNFIAHPHCWGTNPDTGLAWQDGDEVSGEFGVERVAGTESTVAVRVTQCVLEVLTAI